MCSDSGDASPSWREVFPRAISLLPLLQYLCCVLYQKLDLRFQHGDCESEGGVPGSCVVSDCVLLYLIAVGSSRSCRSLPLEEDGARSVALFALFALFFFFFHMPR